jgi:hypothetical protein
LVVLVAGTYLGIRLTAHRKKKKRWMLDTDEDHRVSWVKEMGRVPFPVTSLYSESREERF